MRDLVQQNNPEIKVIPNGITLNNNFQHIEKEEFLLFCGRLVKMKECDILIKALVMPSTHEGFPITALEAMAEVHVYVS